VFNSFQGLFVLFLHIQLLFHPTPLKFPPNFPFVKPIYSQIPTPTVTQVPSPSITPIPSVTISLTPTPIMSPTPIPSPPSTSSPTPTLVITPSPIPSPSLSPTVFPSSVPSLTPTIEPSPTLTPMPTISITPILTISPSNSPSPTETVTPSPTPEISPNPTATITPTTEPSPSVTISLTPIPTLSMSPTPSIAPSPSPEPIGNDISYPQCGKAYPVGQLFGIVGVNGGIASTTNPCLSSQLSWAAATRDLNINQPKVQLYVNTGNPGGLNTATWPQNNIDPLGNGTSNPYGVCDGSNSTPCAWQYGWNRAVDDVVNRFIPAANTSGISNDPVSYFWWLDVETTNSWREGSTEALQANAATLEGMVSYFKSRGISPGIYSTSYQWGVIVGSLSSQSNLNGLPNWIPGAPDLIGAKEKCQTSPFTIGSEIFLTQYVQDSFDYDYSCK